MEAAADDVVRTPCQLHAVAGATRSRWHQQAAGGRSPRVSATAAQSRGYAGGVLLQVRAQVAGPRGILHVCDAGSV